MQLILPSDSKPMLPDCVATVGIFDGIHRGHRFLLEELNRVAKDRGLKSVVITFAVQPRKVLHPQRKVDLLATTDEKIALIRELGVDYCIIMDFTASIARLSAKEFITEILYQRYHVRVLLIGHDHRFGHNRLDGFTQYQQYGRDTGMEVIQASRYGTPDDPAISSSDIRQALMDGDILKANRMLGYWYRLSGTVVEGFKVGRTIGFPTANIRANHSDKIIPQTGVYRVNVEVAGDIYQGMLNIGTRPTLENGSHTTIEVHILDFDMDIYGESISVVFVEKIRDEKKFDGIDALKAQLFDDKRLVVQRFRDAGDVILS